tara:strand:+ start:57 stop:305 length:249 start_codon:yes stop_codon:yes gene_type:complete
VQVGQVELVVQVVEMVQMLLKVIMEAIQFFQASLLLVVVEAEVVVDLLRQMQVMEVQVAEEVQVRHIQVLPQEQEEQVIHLQ